MTEGEVCPNEVESDRNRVPKAVRRSKDRFSGRECDKWLQNGACSATIGDEFGSYLGNVGQASIPKRTLQVVEPHVTLRKQ